MTLEITLDTVRDIRQLIQQQNIRELSATLNQLDTQTATELLDQLPSDEAAIALRMLDKDLAIAVFDDFNSNTQADLIENLGDQHTTEFFEVLEPDEQARVLDELPAKITKRLLLSLQPQKHSQVMTLLGYDEDSAGRHMSPIALHLSPGDRVCDVLDRLRNLNEDKDIPESLPVIDAQRILLGTVTLTKLLRSNPDTVVDTLMETPGLYAGTDENVEHLARRSLDIGLPIAIVDSERRLVGILSLTDAAEIDREAMDEDQARAGGSEPLRRSYLLTPVLAITRARIVWLLVLAVSAILTVQVLEMFEATLEQQVALALFIPLLTGVGGNTGSQAATTVTRALALDEIRIRDAGRVALKEIRTGLLLGAVLGTIAFLVAWPFYGVEIGLVIGLTMLMNCPIAATVGGLIPLLARATKVDPAVFSTPFISTFCDASGLLIYFTVAVNVLGL